MKKLSAVLAILLALTLLTPAALAAGAQTTPVVYNLSVVSGYSVSFKTASDAAAETATGTAGGITGTVYKDAAKLELSFTGNAGEQYAVFLLKGSEVPTQGSIKYIDQTEGTSVKFMVYPYDLSETGEYKLYVSSTSTGYAKVATFGVTDNWEEAPYTLGDVNMDGKINVSDALLILQDIVGTVDLNEQQQQAANVDKSNASINVNDALKLLNYIVGNITEL